MNPIPSFHISQLTRFLRLDQTPDLPEINIKINGILWTPSQLQTHYQNLREKKIEFLHSLNPQPDTVLRLFAQQRLYPLMAKAVNEMQVSLTDWDSFDSNEKIHQQWDHILSLSATLHSLAAKDENIHALNLLTLEPGETLLDKFSQITTTKQTVPCSPISARSLRQQKALMEALKTGKIWAEKQKKLHHFGQTRNLVFALGSKNDPTTFFKIAMNRENVDPASGLWEKMIWDFAVIMGMEESFVPTGMTTVLGWNGSAQPAQTGDTLEELLNENNNFEIGMKNVIKATLTTLLFGMFDAHANNIFITDRDKVLFFDNAFSLPHSNYLIDRGGYLDPPYRSGLFLMNETYKPLKEREKHYIQRLVSTYPDKIKALERYLTLPKVQFQLGKLPPGWFFQEHLLAALKERVARMQNALNGKNIYNLADLVAESLEGYKFAFIINLLDHYKTEEVSKLSFKNLQQVLLNGTQNISKSVGELMDADYDVALLHKWCTDPELSLQEIVQKALVHAQDVTDSPIDDEEFDRRISQGKDVLTNLFHQSKIDLKDMKREVCHHIVAKYNKNYLEKSGVIFNTQSTKKSAFAFMKEISELDYVISTINETDYLIFKQEKEFRSVRIDLTALFDQVTFPENSQPALPLKIFLENLEAGRGAGEN